MLFFGHAGMTVAVAAAIGWAYRHYRGFSSGGSTRVALPPLAAPDALPTAVLDRRANESLDWLFAEVEQIDYRLILVGSVLPDVDKFIGLDVFHSFERSIFHTLLWLLLLAAAGLFLVRRFGDTRGLQLAGCWVVHLVLDQMWSNPRLLLWPLDGADLVEGPFGVSEFGGYMVHSLTTDWHQFVPELLGLAILLWFLKSLVGRGELTVFLKTGRVAGSKSISPSAVGRR